MGKRWIVSLMFFLVSCSAQSRQMLYDDTTPGLQLLEPSTQFSSELEDTGSVETSDSIIFLPQFPSEELEDEWGLDGEADVNNIC